VLMSPELSQWWSKVLTSQAVSLRDAEWQLALRRAVIDVTPLTDEQQSVVDTAALMLNMQRPE
jgi:hypothetical protein